eukprot:gene9841-2034_t
MTRSTTIAEFLVLVIVVALIGPCTAGELKHLPPIQDRPILFNQAELEEFMDLSEENVKLHLINLIQAMDSGLNHEGEYSGDGGDGSISFGELAIRIIRVEFDRQSLDAVYHIVEADSDDDGLLSWEEVALQNKVGLDIARRRFEFADKNKDGWLSETEVEGLYHPETTPRMFPLLSQELMRALDLNDDRRLDKSEVSLDAMLSSFKDLSTFPADLAQLSSWFNWMDKDKDTFLTLNELLSYFEYLHNNRIFTLVESLFLQIDDNKDRALDADEIWRHHELLIGSHGKHQTAPLRPPIELLSRHLQVDMLANVPGQSTSAKSNTDNVNTSPQSDATTSNNTQNTAGSVHDHDEL